VRTESVRYGRKKPAGPAIRFPDLIGHKGINAIVA
jgi:hypothetical protein